MGFVFNPLSGTLDKVKVPLKDNTTAPTLTTDGDIQTVEVDTTTYIEVGEPVGLLLALTNAERLSIGGGVTSHVYYRSQGNTYKIAGTAV